MVSTPPKTAGSPGEETWKRWVEEQVLGLTDGSAVRDTRVQAVSQLATGAGNVAANNAATVTDVIEGSKGLSSTNRVGRPLTDVPFWQKIVSGDLKMWTVRNSGGDVAETSVCSGVAFVPVSGDVSNTAGNWALVLTATADVGSEIDMTPILRPPTSKKIYVRMAYPAPGLDSFCPEIFVSVRDSAGAEFNPPVGAVIPPSPQGSIIDLGALVPNSIDVFTYMVKARVSAGDSTRAITTAEVFEVIGSGDGLAISPGGISVDDGSGNKTIEINPSAPILSAPTAPTFDTSLGSVSVKWDGKLGAGANPPATFSYVRTEESAASSGPWTRVAQPLNKAGSVITRPPAGSTRWYRFIAVDTMNRESPASTAASVVVQGIDIPDLPGEIGDVIDTVDGLNKIFYNGPDTAPTAHANGDLWFVVRPETGTVVDVRIWNGTQWVPYRIVADSVIVPGSVGTVTIADGAVIGDKVVARTLTGEHLAVGSISVDELTPNIGQTIDIKINPALADVESGLEQQQRYYRFDSEGLKIGDPATNEELRLNPGRIEMWQGGNVPTYWEASVFHVERMIVDAANIGNHRFERRAGGGTIIRPL